MLVYKYKRKLEKIKAKNNNNQLKLVEKMEKRLSHIKNKN